LFTQVDIPEDQGSQTTGSVDQCLRIGDREVTACLERHARTRVVDLMTERDR